MAALIMMQCKLEPEEDDHSGLCHPCTSIFLSSYIIKKTAIALIAVAFFFAIVVVGICEKPRSASGDRHVKRPLNSVYMRPKNI